MDIFIERDKTTKTLAFTGTVQELLTQLEINLQTVLVLKNNELVTEDEPLENNDKIELLSVVSGG